MIGVAIIAATLKLPFLFPIEIAGSILLLAGFEAYRARASESNLVGAATRLVSIVLIYFIAYQGIPQVFRDIIGAGPLLSEPTLEASALLTATVGAAVFSLPISRRVKQLVTGTILLVSGILFSCGVMYFNFKAV
ncbi:MAG: hypothetical protein QXN87_08870 [Candidatus Bathyarchaeia archaeon]